VLRSWSCGIGALSRRKLKWTFFHLDLSKITTAPATFEMYAPPVDPLSKILARIPGDSFLQAEINVSL
jgi:myosin-5